jgi:nucleotide-binding universal stress UspA family protein
MNIVAAIDFSEMTQSVVSEAIKFAKAFDAELSVIHVDDSAPYFYPRRSDSTAAGKQPETPPQKEEVTLASIRNRLGAEGIQAKYILLEGPTASNILKAATKLRADYIIIGSQRHSRFYHLLFGNPSDSIIHHTRCPVLIVPKTERPSEFVE